MKGIESIGYWWLPGQQEARVAGTLRVADDGDVRLTLFGRLGDAGGVEERHPIVLGSIESGPRGDEVTLTGCVQTGLRFGSFVGVREDYHADRAYFGAHIEQPGDFSFRTLMLKLGGLAEWARPMSGMHRVNVPLPRKQGETEPIAMYRVPVPITAPVPGGAVTLGVGVSMKGDQQEVAFREEPHLAVDLVTALTADEMNARYVYPFQNLMTFVWDEAREVENFSVWRFPDVPDWEQNPEVRVVGQRVRPEKEAGKNRPDRKLFDLDDVDFPTLAGEWLRLSDRHAAAFNVYFGTLYGPPRYLDITFELTMQTLFLYYSRTPGGVDEFAEGERRLKEILASASRADADWLVERLGVRPPPPLAHVLRRLLADHADAIGPLISDREDAFINRVASTSEYISERDPQARPAASLGIDLYWLTQTLRFVVKACFLREIGFSPDRIKSILRKNALFLRAAQIEADREKRRFPTGT